MSIEVKQIAAKQYESVAESLRAASSADLREIMIIGSGPGDLFWSISPYADRARVLGQLEILKARVLRKIILDI